MSLAPESSDDFDLGAHAWGGATYRDLITFISGPGARLTFFGSDVEGDLRAVLSPTSFIRLLCERGGGLFYVPENRARLAVTLPWLPAAEVEAFCARFTLEKIEIPTPYSIVRTWRHMTITALFHEGVRTHEIGRRVRCSARWVRMVTSGLKRVPAHG